MPAITMSIILEIIHSFRIKCMLQYLRYSLLLEKINAASKKKKKKSSHKSNLKSRGAQQDT